MLGQSPTSYSAPDMVALVRAPPRHLHAGCSAQLEVINPSFSCCCSHGMWMPSGRGTLLVRDARLFWASQAANGALEQLAHMQLLNIRSPCLKAVDLQELGVDLSRDETLRMTFDITFPSLPCAGGWEQACT